MTATLTPLGPSLLGEVQKGPTAPGNTSQVLVPGTETVQGPEVILLDLLWAGALPHLTITANT